MGEATAPLVGAVLEGAYRLTRLIGQGGMGAVYEAEQIRLGRRVAVKLMAADLAANQEALARFRREAEVTSQLGHPHIVQVFDFGAAPTGEPYLVMEYLEGEDLDHRLRKRGRLPLAAAVHIVKQVASALAATHAKAIVHRDLKPANVFLLELHGEDDFVKVVDFGISKVKAATTRLTRASVVMGTPNYMAPEQATGRIDDIDHRTDQWALGCIAYEMLAGRGPFVGEDVASLLYQVIHQEPPPLGARVPDLPAAVEPVLRRALSKGQGDRFPTITAFARAFEAAATGAVAVQSPKASAATSNGDVPATVFTATAPPPESWDDGRTVAKSYSTAEIRQVQPTTFSRTAGELTRPVSTAATRRSPARGLAAGAVGLVVLAGVLVLTLRSGRAPTSSLPARPPQAAPAVQPTAAAELRPSVTPVVEAVSKPAASAKAAGPAKRPKSPTSAAPPDSDATRPTKKTSTTRTKRVLVQDL